MTVAICIKCGEQKRGALTPCIKCGFIPERNEDNARSMIVTDHFLSADDLSTVGQRIRNGQPITYPEDAMAEYIKLFEEGVDGISKKFVVGCLAVIFLIVAVVVGIIVW